MPFWSERLLRSWGSVVVIGAAGCAAADREGGGDNGSGSPLRAHVRWICQLVSENLALSCNTYATLQIAFSIYVYEFVLITRSCIDRRQILMVQFMAGIFTNKCVQYYVNIWHVALFQQAILTAANWISVNEKCATTQAILLASLVVLRIGFLSNNKYFRSGLKCISMLSRYSLSYAHVTITGHFIVYIFYLISRVTNNVGPALTSKKENIVSLSKNVFLFLFFGIQPFRGLAHGNS